MRLVPLLAMSLGSLLVGCATPPKPAVATEPILEAPPLLQLPSDVRPTHYAIELQMDPGEPGFQGEERIAITLQIPRRVIWLHARDLVIREVHVEVDGHPIAGLVEQVSPDGLCKLTLPREIGPGEAVLHMGWSGLFNAQLVGAYKAEEAGKKYIFTMFEPIDARRVFPAFDEPVFKALFALTIVAPTNNEVVANTFPVSVEELAGGKKRTHFEDTKPLPTYLLAWAVGPFDIVEREPLPPNQIRQVPLRVRGVAPHGRGAELKAALDAAGRIVPALERWFGSPYPFQKLDHLAVPDFVFGAEENAGAITYREDLLLFKPGVSAALSRDSMIGAMTHETSHQWFGDLVTMKWWTDIWLNESFATFMTPQIDDEIDPEINSGTRQLHWIDAVMEHDSSSGVRAILQPLTSFADIGNQLDPISYEKGEGVLNTFEHWIGLAAFQAGVRDYLAAHAYGGGSNEDLLAALSRAAGRDVTTPMRTFLSQPGVPLIDAQVQCDGGKAQLALSQRRFIPLGAHLERGGLWGVPVCARWESLGKAEEGCVLLDGEHGALPLGEGCPAWVLPNAGGVGYYRFVMPPADLAALRDKGLAHLTIRERMSLVFALRAAASNGSVSYSELLSTLRPLAGDADSFVARETLKPLQVALESLLPGGLQSKAETYSAALFRPALAQLGWQDRPNDTSARRGFRRDLVAFLVQSARDRETRAEAARLGRAYAGMNDGVFHPEAVATDLASVVLAIAVQESGASLYDALDARLAKTVDNADRERIIQALASALQPELSARALKLPLDPRLRGEERLLPFQTQLTWRETREAAWLSFQASFDELHKLLPEFYQEYLPGLVDAFCDATHLKQGKAFFEPRISQLSSGARTVPQALDLLEQCTALQAAQSASAAAFFTAQ